ncbi:MAG: PilZ domain-containing protein [Thalassolituus sp.]
MQTLSRHYEEKRRYIRMQIDAPAQITTENGETHNIICIDLSSHGVQFETHTQPDDGMCAEFMLQPGGGPVTPLQARIRVCRVTEIAPQTFRAGATIEEIA